MGERQTLDIHAENAGDQGAGMKMVVTTASR